MNLDAFIREVAPEPESGPVGAFNRYKETLITAIRLFRTSSVLEVGGGRAPLFMSDEIRALGVSYTVNDIDASELELAPRHVDKQCFDIGGSSIPDARYDLIFSSCVFEHVPDARRAYQNLHRLLNPGGVAFNLHPCLYSLPFVINKLVPESLSYSAMAALIGGSHHRKFPAYYSWCFATDKVTAMLREVGFSESLIVPFYGHTYYSRIPIVRDLHKSLSHKFAKADARWAASYVYTIARRGLDGP